jgi:alkylhydroperoxidase/carboxymuconolactone decarboxylase family protein YurZ
MFRDWSAYLQTGRKAGAALHKANPKMVAGFQALSAGQNGNGALDAQTKELIALAVAVTGSGRDHALRQLYCGPCPARRRGHGELAVKVTWPV